MYENKTGKLALLYTKYFFLLFLSGNSNNINMMKSNINSQMKSIASLGNESEEISSLNVKTEPEESCKRKREDDDYDVP